VRAAGDGGEQGLADRSGIPLARIRELLAGAKASTVEVAAIADALAMDPAALYTGDFALETQRSVARFRAPQGVARLDYEDARLLARAAEAGRICAHLRGLLDKPQSEVQALRDVRPVRPQPEPWRQGYDLGRDARERLAPERDGLFSVQGLFEEKGIHIAVVQLSTPDIEAASLFERDACPVILLNRKNPHIGLALSRRAILAHELCHLLHDGGERDLTVVSRESSHDPIEKRANGFAPNFLAPTDWVKPKSKEKRRIVREIALRWGLSFEGAAWHAKHVGVITDDDAQHFSRQPEDVPVECEEDIPRTPPEQLGIEGIRVGQLAEGLLSETALLAFLEGVISRGRAAEILTLR
jgi:Zn-dependent peptidase ImmA (M78 family)